MTEQYRSATIPFEDVKSWLNAHGFDAADIKGNNPVTINLAITSGTRNRGRGLALRFTSTTKTAVNTSIGHQGKQSLRSRMFRLFLGRLRPEKSLENSTKWESRA